MKHDSPLAARRRGALLLLVLGMLTFFLLVGTLMLVLAGRARTAARAFADATFAASPSGQRELDQALLAFVRGTPKQETGVPESLLEDMYGPGPALRGEASSIVDDGPLLKVTALFRECPLCRSLFINGRCPNVDCPDEVPSQHRVPDPAALLGGRVLTFDPKPGTVGSRSSYFIAQALGPAATGAAGEQRSVTFWLVNLHRGHARPLPSTPCPVVVNQAPFLLESYDAFDDQNAWLTGFNREEDGTVTVSKPAFGQNDQPATVDNDNDGFPDGVWLEDVLPSRPAPGGGRLEFAASYLVADLDGRLNVNAHGNTTSIDLPAASGAWQGAPDVPCGAGYGPADINLSLLFAPGDNAASDPSYPRAASDPWRRLIGADVLDPDRDPSLLPVWTAVRPTADQQRAVPRIGPVGGRYGSEIRNDDRDLVAPVVPGLPGNDPASHWCELPFADNPTVDLKCRMQVELEDKTNNGPAIPAMIYHVPAGEQGLNYVDDPYETPIARELTRTGSLRPDDPVQNFDNPYSLAELEAVLRQFDPDSASLPPRLANALDDHAQSARMLLTTDSWDTPAITGAIAEKINAFISEDLDCDPREVMSPEVLAGLRLDINRQFPASHQFSACHMAGVSTDAQGTNRCTFCGETCQVNLEQATVDQINAAKQDYCKHLYTLLVALGCDANATTAQWVVNVVDYRDDDSTSTKFSFDTNIANGWQPNEVVWGMERPDIVIAQTVAWRTANDPTAGEVFVTLYRPWASEIKILNTVGGGNQQTIWADKLSPSLEPASKPATNLLDLRRQIGGKPIWRLRFDSNNWVRFDKPSPSAVADNEAYSNSNAALELEPNEYLCVKPAGNSPADVTVDNQVATFTVDRGTPFRILRDGEDEPDLPIVLERLADPSRVFHQDTNPYVAMDSMKVKLINVPAEGGIAWRIFERGKPDRGPAVRAPSFWQHPKDFYHPPPNGPRGVRLPVPNSGLGDWLSWPNRPYISQAELCLVPRGSGTEWSTNYDTPEQKKSAEVVEREFWGSLPTKDILDAVIVPSRFVGTSVTADPPKLVEIGMQQVPRNQLSRRREPGRVNLNTIVSGSGPAHPWAIVAGENAVALDGSDGISLQSFRELGPAKSVVDVVSLMQRDQQDRQSIYLDPALLPGDQSPGRGGQKKQVRDRNPLAAYSTAIRLANVATVRSHVFAVWMTLRIRDTSVGGGADQFRRLFAIVDRSIPVGFSPGEDLNVRDTIRILRYLE